ncbi:MAG TPA: heat-inducible transcription repressor HrcA, partial [Elusimicrobia bacterium]|nr:heat-inducible transcription repressor HrcA [Elusimicrobiota bacterium]
MVNLKERKEKILQILLHHYIRTGQPVGSKTVAENYDLGLSPATIRNCFAELEEEGYLTHPYTSAGRIPTDKGYRFYVDSLIEIQQIVVKEEERIRHEYYLRLKRLEDILNYTSYLLARLSHYAGFVFSPKWERNVLQSVNFAPAGENKLLVTLLTKSGLVKYSLLDNERNIDEERLRRLSRILNRMFSGFSLAELSEKIYQEIDREEKKEIEYFKLAKRFLGQLLFSEGKEDIYLEGMNNIFNMPEFKDNKKLSDLFKFIEEKKFFFSWLKKELNSIVKKMKSEKELINSNWINKRVKVTIGSETPFPEMRDCSVVTSVY